MVVHTRTVCVRHLDPPDSPFRFPFYPPASPGFFRRRSAFLQLPSHTPKKVETQQQKSTNLLVPKLILLGGQKDIRIVIVG